ncbi:MAG: bacteriophage Gp15 family protein, partial [Oscillospiraceae bacterium]|nr:bacteriophage Gp15 family protein [Oscillospiraceae bacterium]
TLIDGGLPYEIDGTPISPDFRNMLRVETIAADESLTQAHKVSLMLNQLYPELPDDLAKAYEGLTWFIHRGNMPDTDRPRAQSKRKAYDFTQDASLIFSAFFATYGINLAEVEFLHWWEFLALFEGLPEDVLIRKVMYWRSCDVSKLSKEEKKHVLEMRKHFAIKQAEQTLQTIEEVNQSTLDYYARRFAAAQEKQKEA